MRDRIQRNAGGKNGRIPGRVPESRDRASDQVPSSSSGIHPEKISSRSTRRSSPGQGIPSVKNTMRYGDYLATVHFSEADGCFGGRIDGIDDLISFEGRSVADLRKAFHEAVDDYLELCRSTGKEPQRSYKGSFNVRIHPELHRRASLKCRQIGISLNQLVKIALEKEVGD
jgi:predicted HicB family RNase H-like nuclease